MRSLHYLPTYTPAWQFGGPVLSRCFAGTLRVRHRSKDVRSRPKFVKGTREVQ